MSHEPQEGETTLRYIDTSALLADLLEEDDHARQAVRSAGRRTTSALTLAETRRAIVRYRVRGRLSDSAQTSALDGLNVFFSTCDVIAITGEILTRAWRPFPIEPVRTLDAIHLATIETLSPLPARVTVITRNRRVRENALALGCQVE